MPAECGYDAAQLLPGVSPHENWLRMHEPGARRKGENRPPSGTRVKGWCERTQGAIFAAPVVVALVRGGGRACGAGPLRFVTGGARASACATAYASACVCTYAPL